MQTLQEVADKYIPRFMSGLMSRDWEKVKSAILVTATEYHEINARQLHANIADIKMIKSPETKLAVSAVLWAIDTENNGEGL